MIALIGQFLAPYALRLAGLAAILGAVGAVLLGARQAGRNAERVEQMRKTIEVQRDQLEVGLIKDAVDEADEKWKGDLAEYMEEFEQEALLRSKKRLNRV